MNAIIPAICSCRTNILPLASEQRIETAGSSEALANTYKNIVVMQKITRQ
jgi:hypothetical protein